MALRYEAWDLPTNATTFQRKIADLPVIERQGSGYLELNDGGEGQLALPDDYARLSEIISSTTGSLIRVYDGTTLVHEWTTERVDHDPEAGIVLISGPDIQALPAKAVVYPFDYPDQPTNDPDWHWGNADNLISNPSFENGVNFIANEGFEEGEVEPWWAGAVNGVDATLAIETTTIDTGSFSAKCTPLVSGGGMSTAVTGLQPSHDYTLSVRVNATAGNSIQLGASGPGGIAVVTGTGVAEVDLNTHEYEAQLDVTAAGGWETAQLVFTTAPGQTNTQVSIRNNTGSPALFYVDVVTLSGQGVGMEGWAISPWDANILITASTDVTPVTGTYTARVNAPDGGGIFTEVANVDNGAVYTVSAWGRTDSGTARWTLDVIDELFRRLGQDSIVLTTTFQQFSVQFTVPDDLPGEREVFFALRNDSGGADIAYFDDVEFYRGKAAANPGTILTDLFNDAQSDHSADTRGTVLTWLDISGFDSTNDSGATPWSSTLSFTAFAGDTYLNVLRNLAKLGYEWNITPKASPSPGLTHDLNVYEPDGLGTDYTAAATPAILTGGTTAARSVVERIPNYTAVLSVGGEGAYSEDSDATAATNFGRWETYARYIDTTSTTELATRAAEALADESVNRSAVKVDVVRSPDHPIPLVDYTVGDLLRWQVPGLVSPTNKRVQRIAYRNTEPAEYQVTGSRVFPGEAGLAEAVRVLLNRFDPLKRDRTARSSRPEVVDGGGGAPTVVVAASDATAFSKSIAQYQCTGSSDEDIIRQALNDTGNSGRILLTEGTFTFNGRLELNNNDDGVTIEGMGPGDNGTLIQLANSINTDMIAITAAATGVRLANFKLNGNKANQTSGNGINSGGVTHAKLWVENIWAVNIEDDAFRFGDNATEIFIRDCLADSPGNQGFDINGGRVVVSGCTSLSAGTEGFLVSGNNVTMTGCHAITSGADGIFLQVTQDSTIVGCTSEQNTGDGIASGASGNGRCVIVGNVSHNNGGWGLLLGAASQNVVVGNIFTSNTSGAINNTDGSTHLIAHNIGGASADNAHAGLDTDAIHDNIAAEISAITEKTTPVAGDWLIIEDSAAADAKKKVQIGNLLIGNMANFSQSGTLSVGSGSFKLPFTTDATIVSVQLAVGTVPTGADLIVDVNKNGTTIFTTQANRPTVPNSDADGVGAEATPDVTSVSQGEYLTVDIDQVGSTVAGADLTVSVEWKPA